MCGIAGLWDRGLGASTDALGAMARRMAESLHHRGPDDGGVWCDGEAGIALGHRRLSIVDLSPAGAQPMISSCGRFVLSYNGEIYNAEELRRELRAAGRPFRGHSDTEVVVEAVALWGVEAAIQRLIGMFAMALWDRRNRTLCLIRDRIEIKPLYWAEFGKLVLFGSELKALRVHGGWRPELDRSAVVSYVRRRYVPGPGSIYRGVGKLPPGTILTIDARRAPALKAYWGLEQVAQAGQAARFPGSDREAVDKLDELLGDAVRRRMVADVPLGGFLSGGIDSSLVVALMQARSPRPVRSFSIGFDERGFNEAHHAAAVARQIGTDHTELYVSPRHALDVIPRLPDIFDEPLANVAQIPLLLLSEMTRKHVSVALSGDGGDELFAGYPRYLQAPDLLRRTRRMPAPMRRFAARLIQQLPLETLRRAAFVFPGAGPLANFGDKLESLAQALDGEAGDIYRLVASYWRNPGAVVRDGVEVPDLPSNRRYESLFPDFVERMQFFDKLTILPDSILAVIDRASMAASLEARVPLLDHRAIAFSWTLPPAMKMRGRVGKWPLRQLLYRYVPPALVERPKMGFDVPIGLWLRGPLRDWAEALLDEKRILAEGIFHPGPIRMRWREHIEGRRNWQGALWIILMFQAWKERWLP
jgi:asparagine synthase (glutamine-hydrolysing)